MIERGGVVVASSDGGDVVHQAVGVAISQTVEGLLDGLVVVDGAAVGGEPETSLSTGVEVGKGLSDDLETLAILLEVGSLDVGAERRRLELLAVGLGSANDLLLLGNLDGVPLAEIVDESLDVDVGGAVLTEGSGDTLLVAVRVGGAIDEADEVAGVSVDETILLIGADDEAAERAEGVDGVLGGLEGGVGLLAVDVDVEILLGAGGLAVAGEVLELGGGSLEGGDVLGEGLPESEAEADAAGDGDLMILGLLGEEVVEALGGVDEGLSALLGGEVAVVDLVGTEIGGCVAFRNNTGLSGHG